VANFLQIITPFILASSFFTMPQAIMNFNPNAKSFFIAVVVIMVVLRLLFALQDAFSNRSRWWKKVTQWIAKRITTMQLDEIATRLPISEYGSMLLQRIRRTRVDRRRNGVERESFEV
jgi:hypothetical protein